MYTEMDVAEEAQVSKILPSRHVKQNYPRNIA
jgi:hypothetical protein